MSKETPDSVREELRKSDPAAFDDDVADVADVDAGEADEAAKAEAAEKAEADRLAAEQAEADKVAAEKADQSVIPKGRFNEVLRERDTERERAEALAAELAALKAGPKVDYDEAIKALDEKWNGDDEFDGTHADYLAQRDALIAQRAETNALNKFKNEQAALDAQKRLDDWQKDAGAFVAANDLIKDKEGIDFANFNRFLKVLFEEKPNATHAEWLDEAMKSVTARAIAEGRMEAPVIPAKTTTARNASDARAATAASAAPPAIAGGVGGRGTDTPTVDFATLKPGSFKKLDKATQAAALGSEDAL